MPRATAAGDQGLPVPFSCADFPVGAGADIASCAPSCQSRVISGRRGSTSGTKHGVAGEGYTIGRARQNMDPPDGRGPGRESLRLGERRHGQPILDRLVAGGDVRVDLLGGDARQREQDARARR